MFHQFFVNEEYRDLLRFFWWDQGDVKKDAQEYQMKVHLFGAASSVAQIMGSRKLLMMGRSLVKLLLTLCEETFMLTMDLSQSRMWIPPSNSFRKRKAYVRRLG